VKRPFVVELAEVVHRHDARMLALPADLGLLDEAADHALGLRVVFA